MGDFVKLNRSRYLAAVAAATYADLERVVFNSSDGLEIEGFLIRPDDISQPVPAVVYPHGGPTSVFGEEWDGHAQYFVDKGYAWLGINFRGSTTYGVEFERANHDDWGVGDTADCIAAGRFLAGLDWVDGERLAIFGASYGSYMALASLVDPENPFACGVAKYGDCNILTSWAQGDRGGGDDLERMMGHPSQNKSSYHAGSPIHDIERIERPQAQNLARVERIGIAHPGLDAGHRKRPRARGDRGFAPAVHLERFGSPARLAITDEPRLASVGGADVIQQALGVLWGHAAPGRHATHYRVLPPSKTAPVRASPSPVLSAITSALCRFPRTCGPPRRQAPDQPRHLADDATARAVRGALAAARDGAGPRDPPRRARVRRSGRPVPAAR